MVYRLRARFLSMDHTLLLGSILGRFHRILELSLRKGPSEQLDVVRTESKHDDRPYSHSHMIPPWTQSRE